MSKIKFVDTTVRDGHQSLWAMNMRTHHMLSVLPHLDTAGFEGIEFVNGGAGFKKLVRDLRENPWDWINKGTAIAKNTPLRWHGPFSGRTLSGYIPQEVGELRIKRAVELGIRHVRTSNNWNDYSVMSEEKKRFDTLGMSPIINLIYSVSPRHTDEYYVKKAVEASALNPYHLCFKDVGGLLTPERIRDLVPKILDATPGVIWEFHGHCNNGLGPVNAIECARLGINILHTAVPPLANANSLPSIFNLSSNLRVVGFEVDINNESLNPASEYLKSVADQEHFKVGMPYEYDHRFYLHQIPGGMISSLQHQLTAVGMGDRIDEVLDEVPQVRADLGYPIMVTPLSQIVGIQAAINVITQDRYSQVTDQTIEYALGRHGIEAPSLIDKNVLDKILNRPRAVELKALKPWEPTLAELRSKYGRNITDEDLTLLAIVGDDALDVVGAGGSKKQYLNKSKPLADLLREIALNGNHRSYEIANNEFVLKVVSRQ